MTDSSRLVRDCDLCDTDAIAWQWDVDPFDHPTPWNERLMMRIDTPVLLCDPCRTHLSATRFDLLAGRLLAVRENATRSDGNVARAAELFARVEALASKVHERWSEQEAKVTIVDGVPIVDDFAKAPEPERHLDPSVETENDWEAYKPTVVDD